MKDRNSSHYASNLLNNRNLVALPNTVWVTDIFTPTSKFGDDPRFCIKIVNVSDLSSREVLVMEPFIVENNGNIESSFIAKTFATLFTIRKLTDLDKYGLLIHSDRGSEYASKVLTALFDNRTKCLSISMSNANTPTDNGVAERLVRTLKSQVIDSGIWPKHFKNLAEVKSFTEVKKHFMNNNHINRNNYGISAKAMHTALENPYVTFHWNTGKEYKDHNTNKIKNFRKTSAEKHKQSAKTLTPTEILMKTYLNTAVIMKTALKQDSVNVEVQSKLYNLDQKMDFLVDIAKKSKKKQPKKPQLPLRDCATGSVHDFLMALECPSRKSKFVWSRNRVTTTFLRWSGCRASDVAALTLEQVTQAINKGRFQIIQPKTGKVRVIILADRALQDLRLLKLDVDTVFAGNKEKPLASKSNSCDLLTENQWIFSINQFMAVAKKEFHLKISTHSYRINYVTSILRSTPLQQVSKLMCHANIETTVRYDRFNCDSDQIKLALQNLT